MSDDELAYLSPGFDLNSLTVPKIRSILVSHDISYPSSAKKAQLIQLLEDEVLPKAKKLLAARARTKRTSKGIEDMPSSQESLVNGDNDDGELMPPPPVPKTPRRRTKKSSTGTDASEDDLAPSTSRTRKPKTPGKTPGRTPGRRSTAKIAASDTETDTNIETVRPSARKIRHSEVTTTPSRASYAKAEESDSHVKGEPVDIDSPFSDENPFQKGSPELDQRRKSTDGKRKSLGASVSEKRKSTSRRKTTSPTTFKQEPISPSRSTFELPVSRLKPTEDLEPTEEFTPEEQLELVRQRAAQGYSGKDLLPPPRRRKQQPTSSVSKSVPWIVLSILINAFAFWWRKEKLEIGYCGVGKPNWSLVDTQVPDWANVIEPQCEPCPQHAFCYPNLETRCESDYVLKPHPYSLFGLVPVPPTCEPDGEKARKVKSVADKAVEELRERRAHYECGDLPDQETPEIAEEELKEELKAKRSKKMSDEEFDDLWTAALGDIVAREEVVSESDGKARRILSSTSLARLGYVCSIRRRVRLTLSFYRLHLSLLVALFGVAVYARYSIRAHRAATAQIPSLVSQTLDRLATQASLKTSGETEEGWISIGQLRDDVLREVLRASDRERVWKHVRNVVEGNANVRVGNRESASGEWGRVWEWIGPVGKRPIEGGYGRRSDVHLLANSREDSGTPSREVEARSWDEGRPIY